MNELKTEYWLRGPVAGISPYLQPAAHALLQARMEVIDILKEFPEASLWEKPAGLASVGFHLQHLAGVLDRLFTYARGERLTKQQQDQLEAEGKIDTSIRTGELLEHFSLQVDKALQQLRNTDEHAILAARGVGRKQIPSNVLGLVFHAAEHTQRHTGQLLVTAKIIVHRP